MVVPAYNEQDRLPKMLDFTLKYLKERAQRDPKFTWEIIVCDDGSKDKTESVTMEYIKRETVDSIRFLKLFQNRGKGGAVRRVK